MINLNRIAISGFPSYFYHCTVTGRIDIRSRMSGEVHSRMKLRRTVNRINTCSVSGSSLAKVFIGDRLDSRNTFQHFIMILTHIHHVIERFGLDIKLFGQYIQLLGRIYHQLGVCQIHQLLIPVRTSKTCLTDSRRNRISLQNHPIQVIVTLLNILQHPHRIIQTAGKYIILRQKTAIFDSQFLLRRRSEH